MTNSGCMTKEERQDLMKKIEAHFEALKQTSWIETQKKQVDFEAKEIENVVKKRINEIIIALSKEASDTYTILLVDEVPTAVEQDWSDLCVADNVDWLLALSPGGHDRSSGGDFYEIIPPSSTTTTLEKKLLKRYRNCKEIRTFHNWWLEHRKFAYISLKDEKLADESMLPKGNVPMWIEVSKNVSDKEVLDFISSKYTLGMSVTLTFFFPTNFSNSEKTPDKKTHELGKTCKAHGWSSITDKNAQGTEDECFIIFRRPWYPVYPENMARARQLLIIVTTVGEAGPELWGGLKSIIAHQSFDHVCNIPQCKYVGQELIKKSLLYRSWVCDGCGSTSLLRFKCSECEDFDICESCKTSNIHNHHAMTALDSPLEMVENHVMSPEMINLYDEREQQLAISISKEFV